MAKHLINSVTDLKEVITLLTTFNRLSHDTETKGPEIDRSISGLFPFHGARSFSHIFATKTDEYYINFNGDGISKEFVSLLAPIFSDPQRVIFYCNAIFDATISHFDNLKINSRIVDVPSIARIEYNKHGKNLWDETNYLSLAYLAGYYDEQPKNDLVKLYIKEHDLYSPERCKFTEERIPLYNEVPLDLMFRYGCDDARSTYDLGTHIIKCINHKDEQYALERRGRPTMLSVAQQEIKLTSVLIDMKISGMKVWKDYTAQAITHEEENFNKCNNEVQALTGGINLNSGKQVAEYLMNRGVELPQKDVTENAYKMSAKWAEKADEAMRAGKKELEVKLREKSRGYLQGNYSTDKKTLFNLMSKYPDLDFLAKITSAKESEKKINTYYKNFLALMDSEGFIHCGLNQETTKTGRFSSSSPNLQNLERNKKE